MMSIIIVGDVEYIYQRQIWQQQSKGLKYYAHVVMPTQEGKETGDQIDE